MSYANTQRWIESTKADELRDSLNWRGIPSGAEGATLATQQGVRGSPIVDAACVPGLELYKVSPLQGQGNVAGAVFANSGDYLWASAGNLDLSLMMWNVPNRGNSAAANQALCFGVMLRGDIAAATQPDDVFGALPAEMVLVSGTHAWRKRFAGVSSTGNSGPNSTAPFSSGELLSGQTFTAGDVSFNGWQASGPGAGRVGSQFVEDTPLPFLVYTFADAQRLRSAVGAGEPGSSQLRQLIAANYATFRIYDFTLRTAEGNNVEAVMPPSMSGVNTNDDSTNSYWYIDDAIIAPRSPRSIAAVDSWQATRTVPVNSSLTIANVPLSGFQATAGETFAVGIAPGADQIQGASYTYDRDSGRFSFIATAAGIYRVVFTASLTAEPGKRAQVPLTITVTS